MSIFAKLADAFREKEISALEAFNDLAEAAAADDSKIDDKKAFAVLQAAGKTAADFEAAVTLIRNKAAWRIEAARGAEAKAEVQKLEVAWGKMLKEREAEVKALNERYQKELDANEAERRPLTAIVSAGELAQARLGEACRDPQLEAEIAEKLRQFQVAQGHATPRDDEYTLAGNGSEARRIGEELEALRRKAAALVA